MQTYQDKYGRFHHKPCINGEPSSNNGWIYTAYADKLDIHTDYVSVEECFKQCINTTRDGRTFLIRSPNKTIPPMSRDEILGMAQLDLLKERHLDGWNFSPRPIPRFNPFKLASQLWELAPSWEYVEGLSKSYKSSHKWVYKNRNYFWENNLDQIYRFAFSVPLVDRHFILQKWGKFNPIYWAIAKIDSLSSKRDGIRWLKYNKDLAGMQSEFPADHPFRLTTP